MKDNFAMEMVALLITLADAYSPKQKIPFKVMFEFLQWKTYPTNPVEMVAKAHRTIIQKL